MISVCFLFFKIPLPRVGGLILPLSFPQALSTEFRVHWRDGHAPSAQTGLRWSPGPVNSFFNYSSTQPRGREEGQWPLIATHRPWQGTLGPSLPGLVLTGWPWPLTPAVLWAPVPRNSSSPVAMPSWPSHMLHRCSFLKTPGSHCNQGHTLS